MLKIGRTLWMLLLIISLIALSGCGSKQEKNDTGNSSGLSSEALAQYQKEQQDLLQTANTQMAELNKKILELNDKIKTREVKLTEAQNQVIDSFEKKRASMNQRRHQIKNVSYNDWNAFKTSFEADLENCCADIDKLLAEL